METNNNTNYETILNNEKRISEVIAQNEKDVAVSEERTNIFNKAVKEVKEIVEKLGEVGVNIDVEYLANNPQELKRVIRETEATVMSIQEEYLRVSNEYTNKVNECTLW